MEEKNFLVYGVTDRSWVNSPPLHQNLMEQIEAALKGGVTMIQLREKALGEEEFLEEAIAVRQLCHQYHVPLIINDNVHIALKAKADGIHVGQTDMDVLAVRQLVGSDMIVGVSARTLEEALYAEKMGADYLGVGAVFPTGTKKDAHPVSYEQLHEICQRVSIPVVAIGGITKENVMVLSGSGIRGVALVSAIFSAKDIEEECQGLFAISKNLFLKNKEDEKEW